MVFLPPPHLATASRPSYGEAYQRIIKAHRRSPLTSASSVIMLVAPDVDAICAARMLADLLKNDDVIHRIIPVSGVDDLQRNRDEMISYTELHTLILLNMGGIIDLPAADWFGDFDPSVTVHVIDSSRPMNLSSLFGAGDNGERIVIWDDGDAENLVEERKSWEALMYNPEPESDDESDSDDEEPLGRDGDTDEEDYEAGGSGSKRRSIGEGDRKGKRRRTSHDDDADRPEQMTREERAAHSKRVAKHYMSGTWHGQSTAGTIYVLATVLERVDNEFLWLAILGLTYQYITSRISRETYDKYHAIFYDEVCRLNPSALTTNNHTFSLNPDDLSIRTTEELRFVLYRHWNLYDAMYHSSYVAGKLGIWKERGRRKLNGLLAKIGFSLPQTQQAYIHMDRDLKKQLVTKLNEVAPEYGMTELSYPSFMRCYGYRSQPMSAADAVEGISALLDVAGGVRIEVEIEGARHGGEWFGGAKIWEAPTAPQDRKRKDDERENIPPGGQTLENGKPKPGEELDNDNEVGRQTEVDWWIKNFWIAYDALGDIVPLKQSLNLTMSVHRAIIRQGTSIIDKQDIRTMRNHRVAVLTQGPDLALFSHPNMLSRLALWLVDALRDRMAGISISARSKRKSLPFVVACLNEASDTYIVVGVMASLDFGDVRKNEFGLAFLDARDRCNAKTRHGTFDTSVLEISSEDLKPFLEALCEEPDGY